MTNAILYKILRPEDYREAKSNGVLMGAPVDLADGFIHFSTGEQLQETADKHFQGAGDIYLLAVDPTRLPPDTLVFEPSRGGALFPHLYAPLPMSAVVDSRLISMNKNGSYSLSDYLVGD